MSLLGEEQKYTPNEVQDVANIHQHKTEVFYGLDLEFTGIEKFIKLYKRGFNISSHTF